MTYQEVIKDISFSQGDKLGKSSCRACTESHCCSHQSQIGISKEEFNRIEHLITKEQIARAKIEIEKLANGTALVCDNKPTYRCPFLSEEGKCEIYEDRFIVCTAYSVISPIEKCNASISAPGTKVAVVDPMGIFEEFMENYPELVEEIRPLVESQPTDILEEFKQRNIHEKD